MLRSGYLRQQAETCLRLSQRCSNKATAAELRVMAWIPATEMAQDLFFHWQGRRGRSCSGSSGKASACWLG
jgi:hypothetical protein